MKEAAVYLSRYRVEAYCREFGGSTGPLEDLAVQLGHACRCVAETGGDGVYLHLLHDGRTDTGLVEHVVTADDGEADALTKSICLGAFEDVPKGGDERVRLRETKKRQIVQISAAVNSN